MLVATAVPDIGPLVSLVGSVGFSILGILVPIIMETVWYWYPKEDGGDDSDDGDGDYAVNKPTAATGRNRCQRFRWIVRHVKNAFLLILGLFALIGGAYYNVRDIVNNAFNTA